MLHYSPVIVSQLLHQIPSLQQHKFMLYCIRFQIIQNNKLINPMMDTKSSIKSLSGLAELGLKTFRFHHIINPSHISSHDYYRYFAAPRNAYRLLTEFDSRRMRSVCMESWE